MREIIKINEPASLTQYRQRPEVVYDGPGFTPVKNDIRNHLLREQGFLCAYCMGRIRFENMKVEHWLPQRHYPNGQLDYRNMLAVCKGNEGQPRKDQHCDTRKGADRINYHPAFREHRIEDRIRYFANGKIGSTETEFQQQMNTILNLNCYRLSQNRKAIIDAIRESLNKRRGRRTPDQIERYIQKWREATEGEFRPYSGTAIYWLKKRMRRF